MNRINETLMPPLPTGSEWTFPAIDDYDDAIGRVARDYALDCYPHVLEIISAEQMMDAYASIGMPVYYHHWSFGKHFLATANRLLKFVPASTGFAG